MRQAPPRRNFFRHCACCSEPAVPASPARRNFLAGGIAALGLGAAAASDIVAPALAQAPKPHRIDVHHHYVPPVHSDAMATHRVSGRPPQWSPAKSLEEMDKAGVATAITSLVQPGVWWGNIDEGRRMSSACNEYGAAMARDHPGRFGLFAAVPLPDTEGSLREIEYALETLHADGIGLFTSYGNKYLGDPSFAAVFDELNRRKAVVFVHPTTPDCCKALVPGVPASTIEFATDTTRAVAGLLFSGTAARYPDVRFIFCHSGGTLPFLAGRFVRLAADKKDLMPNGAIPELQKFYYDVAQGTTPAQLAGLMTLVPASRVLFGTDFPLRPLSEAVDGLANYRFSAADVRAIERENALALLPRLKGAG
jgi:predicted TIM-barrel fold metal-dependent hydrolase